MQPRNRSRILACASSGAIQLLFGPASSFEREQMKVRCSTRATSLGLERARLQPGKNSGLSGLSSTVACQLRGQLSLFRLDPSHQ